MSRKQSWKLQNPIALPGTCFDSTNLSNELGSLWQATKCSLQSVTKLPSIFLQRINMKSGLDADAPDEGNTAWMKGLVTGNTMVELLINNS